MRFCAAANLLGISLVPGVCGESTISAAAYLASQAKPHFRPGHTLPHLTRWGWALPFEARVELARNWGYALEMGGRAQMEGVTKELEDSGNIEARICALAASNPRQFPLAVVLDRNFPEPVPDEFWVHDAEGRFTDGKNEWRDANDERHHKVANPEGPDDYWQKVARAWTEPLQLIHQRAPIAIVLNGGEYGVGVSGWDAGGWAKDARVQAARGNRSWFDYASQRKAHYEGILAGAIRKALPDRELYIYYNTSGESHRTMEEGWKQWAYDSAVIDRISDLPSFECYFRHFNTGWTGNNDALTQFLDSAGYNEGLGAPLSYNWVCGGWDRKGTNDFSDIPHYMGFLKCLYAAGMVGGAAGYFVYPKGGFGAAFPPDAPPQWLQQITALAQVHALFSYVEPFLRQGYLLPGPLPHKWSKDQPAYEFSAGNANVRVLARKLRTGEHWLITAWVADENDRDVKVEIPELGQLTLRARTVGAVYHVTKGNGEIKAALLDENGLLPTENPPVIKLD